MRTVVMLIAKRRRPIPQRSTAGERPRGDKNFDEDGEEEDEYYEDERDDEDYKATDEEAIDETNENLDDERLGSSAYPITSPSYISQDVSPPPTAPRPPLVFSTRVIAAKNSEPTYKFVYTEVSPSLSLFLRKAYGKHKLSRNQKISNLQVKAGDKTFNVDLDSSERYWDWSVVMEITRKCDGPVEVTLVAS